MQSPGASKRVQTESPLKPSKRPAPTPVSARPKRRFGARKGKLSGGIVTISSAAIVAIYALGRANTSLGSDQPFVDAPTAAATAPAGARVSATPTIRAVATTRAGAPVSPAPTRAPASAAGKYKDGTFAGNGNSRHGGMQVTVVIKDGKIASANVTSCGTRYPCSDVNSLVRAAVSNQTVPVNHVSGATDSSQAYKQGLTNALNQAKA
jgi:uncharacterized protein with FMN-binding domain